MRRAGPLSSSHTLTTEAASVLKLSLSLARRRGHAQLTPLHVAATLLTSPKSTLLKSACFNTQPPNTLLSRGVGFEAGGLTGNNNNNNTNTDNNIHHQYYPLIQCRALELCFNVALNRLPTTPSATLLVHTQPQPSLSNALIAALKRAQAHQRRGSCVEQQSQQPLLAIKVELEQLILSILDDPSVSRVMREAGFSSTAVKTKIEENFSSSPVFNCYSNNGGVYSSPPSPPDHQIQNNNTNFWQNPFWKQKLGAQTAPFLFPTRAPQGYGLEEDIKLILELLSKKKRKNNIVIVGDSMSSTEGLVTEIMNRIEKRDNIVPDELKTTHFIKFQFSSVPLRYMKREEVEMNMLELKRKVDTFFAGGKRVIIYTGDLNWTLVDIESGIGYNPVEHLVADIGKMINEYNSNDNGDIGRVWLMGIANYQTYMRCQMKQPYSLENQWCLQPVSVPSGGLALSLHATSVQESRVRLSQNPSQVKTFCSKEENEKLTCCDECTSKYEKEAAVTFFNRDLNKTSTQLPFWLQSHTTDKQKDDLVELRRKWNRLCHIQHQARPIQNNANSPQFDNRNSPNDKSYTCPSSPSWLNTNNILDSNSISFAHSNSKLMRTTSSCPRFRRQQSCHIEFDYNNGNHKDHVLEPNLTSLKNTEGNEVKITLALGNSNGGKIMEMKNEVLEKLKEDIPWHVETASSILEALVEESKSGKKEYWLLIEGNDFEGKKRLAYGIAESLFGSGDYLLHMNMRERENLKMLENALRVRENLVVLVENIDFAGTELLKFLGDRFKGGQVGAMSRKEGKSEQIIFILTKDDSTSCGDGKDLNSAIQRKLEISEHISDVGKKRKTESDSPKKAKNPRIDESKDSCDREKTNTEVYMRNSSSNTLDLNIKAEDEDDENKHEKNPEISQKFLEMIMNRFVFNQVATKDTMLSKD